MNANYSNIDCWLLYHIKRIEIEFIKLISYWAPAGGRLGELIAADGGLPAADGGLPAADGELAFNAADPP
jgi:hypothetical protein